MLSLSSSFGGAGGGDPLLKNMVHVSHSLDFANHVSLWYHLIRSLSSIFFVNWPLNLKSWSNSGSVFYWQAHRRGAALSLSQHLVSLVTWVWALLMSTVSSPAPLFLWEELSPSNSTGSQDCLSSRIWEADALQMVRSESLLSRWGFWGWLTTKA